MTGGVYRLKYHLAKISGHDVGPCSNVSAEIMRVSHDSINTKERKKEEAATKKDEIAAFKTYQSSGISVSATEGSGKGSTAVDSPVGWILLSSLYTPTNVEKSPTHLVCP
jgi:hypothetical protein